MHRPFSPAEKITFNVTESLKNEKITYLIEEAGKNTGTIMVELEPIADGTKLTYATEFEMPGGILGKFLGLLRGIGERDLKKSLEKLKSLLEQ